MKVANYRVLLLMLVTLLLANFAVAAPFGIDWLRELQAKSIQLREKASEAFNRLRDIHEPKSNSQTTPSRSVTGDTAVSDGEDKEDGPGHNPSANLRSWLYRY
jgi:hypothetical protein